MGIKGLNKHDTESLKKLFDGKFEEMLRKCHEFNETIYVKEVDGLYASMDKAGNKVLICYYYGDPDVFDDTVFVIFGEKTDFISRDDKGNYRMHQGEAPAIYQQHYDQLFKQKPRKRLPISFRRKDS